MGCAHWRGPAQVVSDGCSTKRLLPVGTVPPRSVRPTTVPLSDTGGLRLIWAAGGGSVVLLILAVVGLVDLVRNRDKMETWQVVVWAVLIVLVPVIGLVSYLFWRILRSEAMQGAIAVNEERDNEGWRPPIEM
jgi:hypothetical protein